MRENENVSEYQAVPLEEMKINVPGMSAQPRSRAWNSAIVKQNKGELIAESVASQRKGLKSIQNMCL